jgi:acyl carrier protein
MLNERIHMVMGAVFGIDPATIGHDASVGNIKEWDSLRHMNLVLALEDEFGVRFRDDQVEQLISFRLIELSLNELLPSKV